MVVLNIKRNFLENIVCTTTDYHLSSSPCTTHRTHKQQQSHAKDIVFFFACILFVAGPSAFSFNVTKTMNVSLEEMMDILGECQGICFLASRV